MAVIVMCYLIYRVSFLYNTTLGQRLSINNFILYEHGTKLPFSLDNFWMSMNFTFFFCFAEEYYFSELHGLIFLYKNINKGMF